MAVVGELVAKLAGHTRPESAADWDPVGLQLGDPASKVERVAVCHEVTEEVVARVEARPVDLLVSYHPLLFAPTNRILAGRSAEARAFRLIAAGTSLVVTHTDFDAAPGGTADSLAALFSLRDVTAFGSNPDEGLPAIGRHGLFEGTLAVVDAIVADTFGSSGLRISGDRTKPISRLAVIPGSGAGFIEQAAEVADALVTGDVPHHRVVRALDLGVAIVDPGHIATERPGMRSLAQLVEGVAGVDVLDLTGLDPETWD